MKVIDRVCNAPKIQQKLGSGCFSYLYKDGERSPHACYEHCWAPRPDKPTDETCSFIPFHPAGPTTLSCDTFLGPTFKVIC